MVENYDVELTAPSPQEEALYGPAPVPHRPMSTKHDGSTMPIGSRPSSVNEGGEYHRQSGAQT